MTFYDRNDEFEALETAFTSPGHAFYVVYTEYRRKPTALAVG